MIQYSLGVVGDEVSVDDFEALAVVYDFDPVSVNVGEVLGHVNE